jgi:hypothetical protein
MPVSYWLLVKIIYSATFPGSKTVWLARLSLDPPENNFVKTECFRISIRNCNSSKTLPLVLFFQTSQCFINSNSVFIYCEYSTSNMVIPDWFSSCLDALARIDRRFPPIRPGFKSIKSVSHNPLYWFWNSLNLS